MLWKHERHVWSVTELQSWDIRSLVCVCVCSKVITHASLCLCAHSHTGARKQQIAQSPLETWLRPEPLVKPGLYSSTAVSSLPWADVLWQHTQLLSSCQGWIIAQREQPHHSSARSASRDVGYEVYARNAKHPHWMIGDFYKNRYKTLDSHTLTVGIKASELRICYSLVYILRKILHSEAFDGKKIKTKSKWLKFEGELGHFKENQIQPYL